jgi:hypothetical protein
VHSRAIGSFILHSFSFRRLCQGKLHSRHCKNCFKNALLKTISFHWVSTIHRQLTTISLVTGDVADQISLLICS